MSGSDKNGDVSALAVVFVILQLVVFIMASGGNAFVVLVIAKYMNRSSMTNRFITNLAVADMLTGLASLSQVVYTFVTSLNENIYTCLLRYQIVTLTTVTSQLTVTFTTFDRYIAICFPHRYTVIMTNTSVNVMIFISWFYSATVSIMPFVGYTTWQGSTPCIFQLVVETWLLLWMALTLWVFTMVTVTLYAFILRKACQMYRRIQPMTGRAHATSGNFQNHNGGTHNQETGDEHPPDRRQHISSQLRGAKALAAVTVLFTVCWLPYTYFLFRAFVEPEYHASSEWGVANWIVFLGMANSVMNPFIYAWQRRDFNEACRALLGCKKVGDSQSVNRTITAHHSVH